MQWIFAAMCLLAAGALLSLLLGRWKKASLAFALSCIGAAGIVCAAGSLYVLLGHSLSALEINWLLPLDLVRGPALALRMDGLSAWFVFATGILSSAVAVYAWGYYQHEIAGRPIAAHAAMLCLLILSLIVVFCAGNAIVFLVAWEMMSISAFILISFHHEDASVRRAAWMYLIATHIGTALGVFPALAMLISRSGSADFATFHAVAASAPREWYLAVFVLGFVGFCTKAGLMPAHVWLPVAHPAAPSPISALMSGIVIKTGIYGLLRLLTWLPPLPAGWAAIVVALGGCTGLMGILYALAQKQMKRMLAYSSVENIGIIVLGIGLGMLSRALDRPVIAELAFAGALLHVLNHSMFKGLLFLSAGAVLHSTGTAEIERLGGLARKMPRVAALFLLGAAAICALPPLNGFISEWLLYSSMFRTAQLGGRPAALGVAAIAALAAIGGFAVAAFAKVFAVSFLGEPRDASIHPHPLPRMMLAGMAIPAAMCMLIGLLPWLVWPRLRAAVEPLGLQTAGTGDSAPILAALLLVFGMLGVLVLIAGGLFLLRSRSGGIPAERRPTWGCGYAFPTPRMQYTGSSFGWSLVSSFRNVLRPHRDVRRPEGLFPASGQLLTHTPDLPLTRGFEPVLSGIGRFCQKLWPLQLGRIQLYVSYIVATLLVVLVIETWLHPASVAPAQGGETRQVHPAREPPAGEGVARGDHP